MKHTINRVWQAGVLAAALLFALPPVAVFAATEEGQEGGGLSLFIPKLGEFIPMLIGFIILWAVLAKFAWPAFMGMIDRRAATIKDSLEQAEHSRQESERLLEEHRALLAEAKKEAAEIIAVGKQQAEAARATMASEAQAEAEHIIAKAREAVRSEKKVALAELQASAADLTVMVAGKVIGTDLSDAEHRGIIERYLAEAGSFHEN